MKASECFASLAVTFLIVVARPSGRGPETASESKAPFVVSDFDCNHCNQLVIDPRLLVALDELSRQLQRPVQVLSGYRCPTHNRAVGGAPNSYHLYGQAADIRVYGLPLRDLLNAVLRIPAFRNGGIGVYPNRNYLHVDIREHPFRWGAPIGITNPKSENRQG